MPLGIYYEMLLYNLFFLFQSTTGVAKYLRSDLNFLNLQYIYFLSDKYYDNFPFHYFLTYLVLYLFADYTKEGSLLLCCILTTSKAIGSLRTI